MSDYIWVAKGPIGCDDTYWIERYEMVSTGPQYATARDRGRRRRFAMDDPCVSLNEGDAVEYVRHQQSRCLEKRKQQVSSLEAQLKRPVRIDIEPAGPILWPEQIILD